MRKIVAVFPNYSVAEEAIKKLVDNDLADYSLAELGLNYEKQMRQEIFLRPHEVDFALIGSMGGMLIMGLIFYLLSLPHNFGILIGRFLAGGLPVVLFTGAGIGLAFGGLLGGIYSLSLPFSINYSGYWLLSLFCSEAHKQKALQLIKENGGLIQI